MVRLIHCIIKGIAVLNTFGIFITWFMKDYCNLINVGGELLLGGAYSDSVFRSKSDFSDLYTSIKDVFNLFMAENESYNF